MGALKRRVEAAGSEPTQHTRTRSLTDELRALQRRVEAAGGGRARSGREERGEVLGAVASHSHSL